MILHDGDIVGYTVDEDDIHFFRQSDGRNIFADERERREAPA